jgi:hypothetical protein
MNNSQGRNYWGVSGVGGVTLPKRKVNLPKKTQLAQSQRGAWNAGIAERVK